MTEHLTADEILAEMKQETLDEAAVPELSEDFFYLPIVRTESKELQSPDGPPRVETKTFNLTLKIQIKPLKIKYQKQFAKLFGPIIDTIATHLAATDQMVYFNDAHGQLQQRPKTIQDLLLADWITIMSALFEAVDMPPKMIQILCHNDGQMVTDDELDESSMQPAQQYEIILRAWKKGGEMERQLADFFEYALKQGKNGLNVALKSLQEQTGAAPTTNIA